ncbi:MAG: prephenate dehydrogenase/arogenate dehydrogenase family protein [Rhodobacteraceae bacterium]|nr:prephenate dehydrogenase/arogenate dehydrogenase family protein [Paracoccaceae bacterium]
MISLSGISSVGLIGFGAFGQLIAQHLSPHVPLVISDPAYAISDDGPPNARFAPPEQAAACPLVLMAVPVSMMAEVCTSLAPYMQPGSIVADVGSVKLLPARVLQQTLPQHVDLVGTHPLFGPQSAQDGIAGHKIAICNIRGRSHLKLAAVLRRVHGLKIIFTTPEAHDREAALVQGLTHLIAKSLIQMGPLPNCMTTTSFELLVQAADMVRDDAPEVFSAINQANPFSAEIRDQFLSRAIALSNALHPTEPNPWRKKEGSPQAASQDIG